LQGGGPRGSGSPGAGGWPTIRYYNKETGIGGANYEKKTDMAMCSELGPEGGTYLQAYIEEAGDTSLCSIEGPDYKGCSDKEKKFIIKMLSKTGDEVGAQVTRLEGMKDNKMKDELKQWLGQRLNILKKIVASPSALKSEL